MITTAIFNLFFWIVSALVSPILLFSDVSLSPDFTTSIATASGYYHSLNSILPVDTMIQILGISLAFELAYLIFKVIMWVLKKIPTIN